MNVCGGAYERGEGDLAPLDWGKGGRVPFVPPFDVTYLPGKVNDSGAVFDGDEGFFNIT